MSITHTGDKYSPDYAEKDDCTLEYSCANCPTGDVTATFSTQDGTENDGNSFMVTVSLSSTVLAGLTAVTLQVGISNNAIVTPVTSNLNIEVVPCAITAQTIPTFTAV